MISPMHYGFAQPFISVFIVPVLVGIIAPSWWIGTFVLAVFMLLIVGGDLLGTVYLFRGIR